MSYQSQYKSPKFIAFEPLSVEEYKFIRDKLRDIISNSTYYTNWNNYVMIVYLHLKDGSLYKLKGSQLKELFKYLPDITIEKFKESLRVLEI